MICCATDVEILLIFPMAEATVRSAAMIVVCHVRDGDIGLCNPVGPGLYQVYMSDGTFRECFLFQNCGLGHGDARDFIILDKETKAVRSRDCSSDRIWVSGPSEDPKWMEKIPASNTDIDMSADNRYDRYRDVCSLLITPFGVVWEGRFQDRGDFYFYEGWSECSVCPTSASLRGFKKLTPFDDRSPVICHKDTILRRYACCGGD